MEYNITMERTQRVVSRFTVGNDVQAMKKVIKPYATATATCSLTGINGR